MPYVHASQLVDHGTRIDDNYSPGAPNLVEWWTYDLGDVKSVSVKVTITLRTIEGWRTLGTVSVMEHYYRIGSGLNARQARAMADACLRAHTPWRRTKGERARYVPSPDMEFSQWSLTSYHSN